MTNEARMSEEKAIKAMIDASRLAEELRAVRSWPLPSLDFDRELLQNIKLHRSICLLLLTVVKQCISQSQVISQFFMEFKFDIKLILMRILIQFEKEIQLFTIT